MFILQTPKTKFLEICQIYSRAFGYKPEFYLESIGQHMNFTFIITTLNAKTIDENIHDFRNDILRTIITICGYFFKRSLDKVGVSPILFILFHRFLIRWEEKKLEETFGEEYLDYKRNVRQWFQ